MRTKIAALLVGLSVSCFASSVAIGLADWPDVPELAALLDFADILASSAGVAFGVLAGCIMLWKR